MIIYHSPSPQLLERALQKARKKHNAKRYSAVAARLCLRYRQASLQAICQQRVEYF